MSEHSSVAQFCLMPSLWPLAVGCLHWLHLVELEKDGPVCWVISPGLGIGLKYRLPVRTVHVQTAWEDLQCQAVIQRGIQLEYGTPWECWTFFTGLSGAWGPSHPIVKETLQNWCRGVIGVTGTRRITINQVGIRTWTTLSIFKLMNQLVHDIYRFFYLG